MHINLGKKCKAIKNLKRNCNPIQIWTCKMEERKKCAMGEPKQHSTVDNELPHDLKETILTWMPVKSMGRFSTVSKQWNTLLSSKKFITTKWAEAPPNREPWLVIHDNIYLSITWVYFSHFN